MTSKHTTLPLLALVASIAITMMIPSAFADGDIVDKINAEIEDLNVANLAIQDRNDTLDETIAIILGTNSDIQVRMYVQQDRSEIELSELNTLIAVLQAFPLTLDEVQQSEYTLAEQSVTQAQLELDYSVALLVAYDSEITANNEIVYSLRTEKDANFVDMLALDERVVALWQSLAELDQ